MTTFRPNQFRALKTPGEYREGRWRSFEPRDPVPKTLRGREHRLRPGLTFTPYANPTPCNAHCSFCSEELLRNDAHRLTAQTIIGDHDQYFAGLHRAWTELAGFEMGLSLSGLEATSHPAWLLRLLALVRTHGAIFPSRVLYTNGSGLVNDGRLIPALVESEFTGVELSRAHFDARLNHLVMRFDRGQAIREASQFTRVVTEVIAAGLALKLVCIVNELAVSKLEHVERYVDQARELGVTRVVFRALSELGDLYVDNKTTRWIASKRVSVRAMAEAIFPNDGTLRPGWEFVGVTSGYYYSNEIYVRRGVEVVFESSSYVAHDDGVKSGVLQKLVFHSNGDLCGDWVPNAQVIGNYFTP
ncbi:MAG: hypothetical protein DI536_20630 [Archangium gephyra]|uniref:Radical SAM protein n=1 Tax=Archangium gephyra TaxID=48 RepID=A0A2W5T5B3_9BACT|nr:MAG: hypothetical protein DI536_20630 [Archangium gephyra]